MDDAQGTGRRALLVAELERQGAETLDLFASLPADADGRRVSSGDASWIVHDVLAHLVTIERSMQQLFADLLAGGPGDRGDFDIERFNRSQPAKLASLRREELLRRLAEVRRDTVALVEGIEEADLDRPGRHPWLGDGRLEDFLRWAYRHGRLHQDEVRRAVAGAPE